MKGVEVRTADASHNELARIAERCGFRIKEGKKHTKIETQDGKFITVIPRHERIKRETAKGIAKAFQQFCNDVIIR
ncbi:MAG TPA: hypothetical protein VFK06_25135 [Candidatus Angelobacter sp.]|nr:hypothetical protein [Candidatus Angelobacter sp.]